MSANRQIIDGPSQFDLNFFTGKSYMSNIRTAVRWPAFGSPSLHCHAWCIATSQYCVTAGGFRNNIKTPCISLLNVLIFI